MRIGISKVITYYQDALMLVDNVLFTTLPADIVYCTAMSNIGIYLCIL